MIWLIWAGYSTQMTQFLDVSHYIYVLRIFTGKTVLPLLTGFYRRQGTFPNSDPYSSQTGCKKIRLALFLFRHADIR